MKRTVVIVLSCLFCLAAKSAAPDSIAVPAAPVSAPLSATMTARDAGSAQWYFAMAPDDVLPLLPVNTRLDMLDYYNSGVSRPSRDAAGGRAIVTGSSSRRVTFETGDTCSYELAVFTAGSDTIVALVETIRYPMQDSRIAWYDSRWRPIAPPAAEPNLDDWLTRDGRKHRQEVEEAVPFMTSVAEAGPESGTLTLRRTIDAYFVPSERPDALRWLRPSIVFRFKGGRFEKEQ